MPDQKHNQNLSPSTRGFIVLQVPIHVESDKSSVIMIVSAQDTLLAMHLRTADQVLQLCDALIEEAAKLWPENEFLKEYLEDDSDNSKGDFLQ